MSMNKLRLVAHILTSADFTNIMNKEKHKWKALAKKHQPQYYANYIQTRGSGSSVGIANGYELDSPEIESWWGGEIFRTCPDRPWIPSSFIYNGYRVFPGGIERPGRDADTSPPSSVDGHERVELYLYSPYGPYGLYRASVPVQ
jgi:hypothetical protein